MEVDRLLLIKVHSPSHAYCSLQYDPEVEADRLLLIKVLLHAADIGNAVRPFAVSGKDKGQAVHFIVQCNVQCTCTVQGLSVHAPRVCHYDALAFYFVPLCCTVAQCSPAAV